MTGINPFSADAIYGPDPTAQQPSDTAVPEHAAGARPEPVAKTMSGANLSLAHSPAVVVVVMLGAALALLNWVSR